jgi:transposase
MLVRPEPIRPVPKVTVRVAEAAFPKGNLYMHMRNALGTVYWA